MKYCLPIFCLLCLYSCKKSDDVIARPPVILSPVPVSISTYYPQSHVNTYEQFIFGLDSQLVVIRAVIYDSSAGTPSIDSIYTSFTLPGNNQPPTEYQQEFYFPGNSPSGAHHILTYADGQVIVDSISSSEANDFSVYHLLSRYPGNINIEWYSPDASAASGYSLTQVDSSTVTAGNLLNEENYSVSNGQQEFNHSNRWTYGTELNPLYNLGLASNLAGLLLFNNAGDFLSKNLPDQYTVNGSDVTTYTWVKDAQARVVQGVGSLNGVPSSVIITYTYGQ